MRTKISYPTRQYLRVGEEGHISAQICRDVLGASAGKLPVEDTGAFRQLYDTLKKRDQPFWVSLIALTYKNEKFF